MHSNDLISYLNVALAPFLKNGKRFAGFKPGWLAGLSEIVAEIRENHESAVARRAMAIVAYRFGLCGETPKTLKEIANMSWLHRGRVVSETTISHIILRDSGKWLRDPELASKVMKLLVIT